MIVLDGCCSRRRWDVLFLSALLLLVFSTYLRKRYFLVFLFKAISDYEGCVAINVCLSLPLVVNQLTLLLSSFSLYPQTKFRECPPHHNSISPTLLTRSTTTFRTRVVVSLAVGSTRHRDGQNSNNQHCRSHQRNYHMINIYSSHSSCYQQRSKP